MTRITGDGVFLIVWLALIFSGAGLIGAILNAKKGGNDER